ALLESISRIKGATADKRLQHVLTQTKKLQERFELLTQMAQQDFLAKIRHEIDGLQGDLTDSRVACVLETLVRIEPLSINTFFEKLLDRLMETTGGRRAFVLLYVPKSTEAEVICARHFETTNLALQEYAFSRTILRNVLQTGKPVLLDDASLQEPYSREQSVRNLELKSVLAVPLKRDNETIGAVYLDDNRASNAFDEDDLNLLESVNRFVTFYLHHAGLLPALLKPGSRVFMDGSRAFREIVGNDLELMKVLETVRRVADSSACVLIEGESGTGKELVARALHYESKRADSPFIAINCAAIPKDLMESEFFGHEKGAFTGATHRFVGHIQQAHLGTLFLDELSELAYPLQAKLLRLLQSGEFHRLGSSELHHAEIRVVAATSKDLKPLVESGAFQKALYYRLSVVPIRVPTLRERPGDIPLLAKHFVSKYAPRNQKVLQIEQAVMDTLQAYPFPGNVRELENLIHRLVVLAEGSSIKLEDVPMGVLQVNSHRINLAKDPLYRILTTPPRDLEDWKARKDEMEHFFAEQRRQLASEVVDKAGSVAAAARQLGVHRVTLHTIVKEKKL
ncbi:MAG: hypothetical protein DMG06_28580, partial [Acidobacteria bacterium]